MVLKFVEVLFIKKDIHFYHLELNFYLLGIYELCLPNPTVAVL